MMTQKGVSVVAKESCTSGGGERGRQDGVQMGCDGTTSSQHRPTKALGVVAPCPMGQGGRGRGGASRAFHAGSSRRRLPAIATASSTGEMQRTVETQRKAQKEKLLRTDRVVREQPKLSNCSRADDRD